MASAQSVSFLPVDSALTTEMTEPIAPGSPCACEYRLEGSVVVAHTVVAKPPTELYTECLVLLLNPLVHILSAPSPQLPHEVGEQPATQFKAGISP